MQPEAATAVLKKCKEHGIRTAIETTAFAKPLAFSRFIANADMIIIDLKHYSEKKYDKRSPYPYIFPEPMSW